MKINHSDRIIKVDGHEKIPAIIMWFYHIKDINNFYFRKHPKNLNPISDESKNYWEDFRKKSIG